MPAPRTRTRVAVGAVLALLAAPLIALAAAAPASAAPVSVSVPGDFNSELGCASDFDPSCTQAQLVSSFGGDAWTLTVTIPAGTWNYNIAINGAFGPISGQRSFTLAASTSVTFYYSDIVGRFSSTAEDPLVTATGSFQSELGCPADYQPDCPETWLFKDSTGAYSAVTTALPASSPTYDAFAAHDRSFTETYGAGGVPGGPSIPFAVTGNQTVIFSYNATSHVLTILVESPAITAPATVAAGGTISGAGQGFAPGETVALVVAGGSAGTIAANEFGRFGYSATVPAVTPVGPSAVGATGGTSTRTAQQPFVVTAAAAPAPGGSGSAAGAALAPTGRDADILSSLVLALVLLALGSLALGASALGKRRRA